VFAGLHFPSEVQRNREVNLCIRAEQWVL